MSSQINRIAGGVLALLTAVAVIDVSNLRADEFDDFGDGDVIATTCGAGTLKQCGQAPVQNCDWEVSLNWNPSGGSIGFTVKRTNCSTTGYVPIYKDNERGSYVFSPSCQLLSPLFALPSGSGCSE